jgi:methionyl-tRNA synthetase
VRYIQFMGKDNVPFHTLSFPTTILGSGEPWKLVDYIKSFNYLNYGGGQFSTSQGRGVFMDQALEILPADYWRWWLIANVPEGSDSNFTWESFQAGVNKDLADVLGNFVSRVTKFAAARFGGTVPEGGAYGPEEAVVIAELGRRLAGYEAAMEAIELRKASQELRAIWAAGNEYLQAAAPWTAIKTDPARAAAITRFAFNLIRLYAVLSRPFLPDTAERMFAALRLSGGDWPADVGEALAAVRGGDGFDVPGVLFAKLDDATRAELELRFAGSL